MPFWSSLINNKCTCFELGFLFCKLISTYLICALILAALYLLLYFSGNPESVNFKEYTLWMFCPGYSDSSDSNVLSYSDSCHNLKVCFLFIKSFLFHWGIILFTFPLFFCPFFLVLFDTSVKGSSTLFNAVVNHGWIYYYSANYSALVKHWRNCNHTNSVESME